MDVSGSHQLDVSHHIIKKPLDRFGAVVGDEIKHELGPSLSETQAVVNDTMPLEQTKTDPTKVPGYCGPWSQHASVDSE